MKSETATEAIDGTTTIFQRLGWPNAVKIDNGFSFAGDTGYAGRWKRIVSQFVLFLLARFVIPMYGEPRSPWQQGTGEGSNNVFGNNFWTRHPFRSHNDIDDWLQAFNASSEKYACWKPWRRKNHLSASFIPRVCFIRKVQEDARGKNGAIDVFNDQIAVPKEYIGLFLFVDWNMKKEQLTLYFERERKIKMIKRLPFPMNASSKKRCSHFIEYLTRKFLIIL